MAAIMKIAIMAQLCSLMLAADCDGESCKENNDALADEVDETGLLQVGMHGTGATGSNGTSGNQQSAMGKRMVNGTVVQNVSEQYSFFAVPTAGKDKDYWLGCGATIISPTYGLTAAHCFANYTGYAPVAMEIGLWLGDVNRESIYQDFHCPMCSRTGSGLLSGNPHGRFARINAKVHIHPLFDGHCSHGNDVVLLELQSALPNWVTPVRINLDGAGSDKAGEKGTVIGWGLTQSSSDPTKMSHYPPKRLREAKFAVFPQTDPTCSAVLDGGYGCTTIASQGSAINRFQQMCCGSEDGSQGLGCGESGTPFLDSTGVQAGLVSYGGGPGGSKVGPGALGADPKYKNIYSRVSAYSDFIKGRVTDLPGLSSERNQPADQPGTKYTASIDVHITTHVAT